MYNLYLKNSSGRYYYGIQFSELGVAVLMALEVKDIVPSIMITNSSDCSVFESESGTVVHPQNLDESKRQRLNIVHTQIANSKDEIEQMIATRADLVSNPLGVEFQAVETALIASAIALNVDLYSLGWNVP